MPLPENCPEEARVVYERYVELKGQLGSISSQMQELQVEYDDVVQKMIEQYKILKYCGIYPTFETVDRPFEGPPISAIVSEEENKEQLLSA